MFKRFMGISKPSTGSVIYISSYGGLAEISGICIDDRTIATISKDGLQQLSLKEFSKLHPTALPSELFIPYEPGSSHPLFFPEAVERAQALLDGKNSYRAMLMNSHQFCSGCITGNYDNQDNNLVLLKQRIEALCDHKIDWRT